MRIDLPLYDMRDHNFHWVVEADIVDVAPHLANVATFAVYLFPWTDDPADWRVANVETSSTVCTHCRSRAMAIKIARGRLDAVTESAVLHVMQVQHRMQRRQQKADAAKAVEAARRG